MPQVNRNINRNCTELCLVIMVLLVFNFSVTTAFTNVYSLSMVHKMTSPSSHPLSTSNMDDRIHLHLGRYSNSIQKLPLYNDISNGSDTYDRYIVILRDGSTSRDRSLLLDDIKMRAFDVKNIPKIVREYDHIFSGFSISISKNDSDLIQMIYNNPDVAIIEKDQRVQIFDQTLPTGVNRIDGDLSPALSGNGQGSVDADIAILDTGVDLDHPDLNVYRQRTFVEGTTTANDDNGHGTHVAGIAAAKDNGIGVVGTAPGARIWAVKVLDSSGSGFISDIIAAIDYLTQSADEVDVANMSFGCRCVSSALDAAISNSVSNGITYVAAAGNESDDASSFSPANNENVIAVSAIVDTDGKCGGEGFSTNVGIDDSFASFSNYGPVIDLASPGVLILSTYLDGSYATQSGTSMAAPHAAGAAALHKANNPESSPSGVKAFLISIGSSPSTICDGNGHGYFNRDPDAHTEPLLYMVENGGHLTTVAARQTNNIVNTNAYYDIIFKTATTAAIKEIRITFPSDTDVSIARLVEAEGIGKGVVGPSTISGQQVRYIVNTGDVTTIPAGTEIRIELSNIVNPSSPRSIGNGYTVTVETRGTSNNIIDGPSESFAYPIKQIESSDIADGAIKSTKPVDYKKSNSLG
jgi:subtilisin